MVVKKCVVCVLLQLDKVPLNVYGSFGHTPVIIYFLLTIMDPRYDKMYLYYKTSLFHGIYISNELHGKCMYKGWAEGQPRLPGCHLGCWAAQMSIALTMSQTNTS